MKKIIVLAAATLIATPALAQSASSSSAAATSKPQIKKNSKPVVREEQGRSAYSANPEYDVYFRGEYVGSDPDPRIRWTLRNEARRSYGLGD